MNWTRRTFMKTATMAALAVPLPRAMAQAEPRIEVKENMEDRVNKPEQAAQLFRGGLNCSQAILTVFGASCGVDREQAKRLGRPLGGGLCRMGKSCGAVTGALLVLGLAQGNPEDEAKARNDLTLAGRELIRRFAERHGSIVCRELLQADMSTEAGARKIKEEELVMRHCPAFVQDAAEMLHDLLAQAKQAGA